MNVNVSRPKAEAALPFDKVIVGQETVEAADAAFAPVVSKDEPKPEQRREMLTRGVEDFDRHFPPETAEQAVGRFLAREADDENSCWGIEAQHEIEVSAVKDGTIEIEQKSPMGDSENSTIWVTRSNAVRLARSILYAAGFKNALIATACRGGYRDVEDGNEAWQFEYGGDGK